VFSALYRHVESLAAAEPGVIGLRLYVEENNKRAQRTYEALGMTKPSYLVMESLRTNKSTTPRGED
jgi:ribosomal protein S18 acetylase RimI-like enzyme